LANANSVHIIESTVTDVLSYRTLDEGIYKTSVSLAARYEVPLWKVYAAQLEFLFSDSG